MASKSAFTFSLDTPKALPVGSRDYYLRGWCFANSPSTAVSIRVVADGIDAPAFTGFTRPDVADFYHNPSVALCGFLARFRPAPDVNSVSLLAKVGDAEFILAKQIPISRSANKAGAGKVKPDSSKASSYSEWVHFLEADLFWREDEIISRLKTLPERPLISIILPTYNTPPYFLNRCIESVLDQHYENWQLCITDDRSSDKSVWSILEDYARRDNRIEISVADHQGGISMASNLSLKNAKGRFVVLLDHDDELHPYALLELVRAINASPEAHLFYSDEDKIDELGTRSQPSFKPDFDANIFLSFNYLGHMIALKRALVNELGGFRSCCDGAQDWDLLLRAMEVLTPSGIRHIRKPLYHWRMHENSTSVNLHSKPHLERAWTKVIEDHVKRTAKAMGVTQGLFIGSMRLKYPRSTQPEAAVFLRPQDGAFQSAVVKMNAGSVAMTIYQLVDSAAFELQNRDGSVADSSHSLCSITELKGDFFVFINGPLESLSHLFFEELAAQVMREDCGLVTGISLGPDNRVLATGYVRTHQNDLLDPYAGVQYPRHTYMGQINVVRAIDACPETFFAVRRECLADIGGIAAISSSQMFSLSRELSKKCEEKGLSILFTPYAVAKFSESCRPSATLDSFQRSAMQSFKLNPSIFSFRRADQLLEGSLE